MEYQIISDSACDLSMEMRKQYQIDVVPFYISFDQETYYKEIEDIGVREVYQRMVDEPKNYLTSSLPSVQDYVNIFKKYVEMGRAVLCCTISVALSGSYNSAANARQIVLDEYPEAQIEVIDSLGNTVTEGLFVLEAARMQQAGYTLEQTTKVLRGGIASTERIFFTVGNLDYLKHGGRIGKLAGIAGGLLNIKPLIVMKDGNIDSAGVVRSRKRSILQTFDLLKKYFRETGDDPKDYQFMAGFGYDIQEALDYQKEVEKLLTELGGDAGDLPLIQIGATTCVHTGPYSLGVGLIKKYECYL